MEGRPKRRLVITVRAAADLSAAPSSPYVVLQLGGQTVETGVANIAGSNPVWDEPIELQLPPPLPNEQPLQVKVKVMQRIRMFPDRLVASGTTQLTDILYGAGRHEVSVPLSDSDAKPCGHIHLGLELETEAGPGEHVGSAAGTMLGEVMGVSGPASPRAEAVPGPVLPSSEGSAMQAREILGAGLLMDPSKPGFGLHT